jgi:hypothetical protein
MTEFDAIGDTVKFVGPGGRRCYRTVIARDDRNMAARVGDRLVGDFLRECRRRGCDGQRRQHKTRFPEALRVLADEIFCR